MKLNLSENERARRAASISKTRSDPEVARKLWLARLARSTPFEKRRAIIEGLLAGKSPESVYRMVKRDIGEVHIATVRRFASIIRKLQKTDGPKPGS